MTTHDYAFGREWAETLIGCFSDDPFAQQIMDKLRLTLNDLRLYYLQQPYYAEVVRKFTELSDINDDPVEAVLMAVYAVKKESRAKSRLL